jgi:hypothetical protein
MSQTTVTQVSNPFGVLINQADGQVLPINQRIYRQKLVQILNTYKPELLVVKNEKANSLIILKSLYDFAIWVV